MSFTIIAGEGGAPAYATYMQMMGAFAMMSGDDIFQTPYHFTAVQQAADKIDLSGGYPQIFDVTQFGPLLQRSSAGVVTVFYPQSDVFEWDSVNNRLQVVGATFVATDKFIVTVRGADRAKSLPDNAILALIKNHYQLNGDSAGIEMITAAQDFTASWVDLGPEIAMSGYNGLKLWLTVDINNTLAPRIRVVEKHESGGVEEYPGIIETYGSSDIKYESGYWERNVLVDALDPLIYKGDGLTPYVQPQILAGTVGATAGSILAAYYTRGTF